MVSQRAPPLNSPAPASSNVTPSISDYLRARNLPPTQAWLDSFAVSARSNAPTVALQKTAEFRILAADLITCLHPTSTSVFPRRIADADLRELRLPGPITVQVLDVEDIGQSCWSQVEAIEAHERGEFTKGREIVRVVPEDEDTQTVPNRPPPSKSHGPHKLLLQDARGTKVYAVEHTPVQGVGIQMEIGKKLVLRDVLAARGVILLNASSVEILGGKVDVWDRKFREERKDRLKRKAESRNDLNDTHQFTEGI
ncbi:hypothetical protein K431DRAFT_282876 [Polychaeton citri CBS 116435]|uniref:RecQ-mediated genome instability protein 1 n=1 Tax=Polychaeton citri CBS 116435 TaxID=1314669 RepID=A0A9P4QCJ3_9PEZI|nr:hypothetical protein K431DRAFT_282876 [Polychaeton citri CBS 116435]